MFARNCHVVDVVLTVLLIAAPAAHAHASRSPGKAVPTRRHAVASWVRIGLQHVTPQDVLEALRQGREWSALLHGTSARHLTGVALVIPSRRDNALFVRGTRAGVRQLREVVGLLDTARRPPSASVLPQTVTRSYQMALLGDWSKSLQAAEAVLSRDPVNAEAMALKAYGLVQTDRSDAASPVVVRALQETEGQTGRARALALIAQGAYAEAQGNKAIAVSSFQQAGNADESCGLSYLAYADYFHRHGNDETAKKLLQAGLSVAKTTAEKAAIRAQMGER